MKIKLHVPTEQYGFVEAEMEATNEQSDLVKETYDYFSKVFKVGEGLEVKEFNRALDEYLSTNELTNGTELYAKMSPVQQTVFQEVKKSIKRIDYKNGNNQE